MISVSREFADLIPALGAAIYGLLMYTWALHIARQAKRTR